MTEDAINIVHGFMKMIWMVAIVISVDNITAIARLLTTALKVPTLRLIYWHFSHRRTGQGGGSCPSSLVGNISYSGNFYLRVGQSSCSCFVSLIFLIFSFHLSLAPCIKTHTKTQEMALKRLYF